MSWYIRLTMRALTLALEPLSQIALSPKVSQKQPLTLGPRPSSPGKIRELGTREVATLVPAGSLVYLGGSEVNVL